MFKIFENLTKATLGVVFSPVSIAADLMTLGGELTNRGTPYTVAAFRDVMRNMELAFNPDELSDSQIREIMRELEKKK